MQTLGRLFFFHIMPKENMVCDEASAINFAI